MIELFSVTPFSGGSLLLMQIQRNYLARTVNYLLVFMLEYPKAKAVIGDGILRVCVRVELKTNHGHGLDTVSYVDTHTLLHPLI